MYSSYGTFLLTPLREGRHGCWMAQLISQIFLLTPLREGRLAVFQLNAGQIGISTHAPAGGATSTTVIFLPVAAVFLLTPLREGRHIVPSLYHLFCRIFLLTPLREGRRFAKTAV